MTILYLETKVPSLITTLIQWQILGQITHLYQGKFSWYPAWQIWRGWYRNLVLLPYLWTGIKNYYEENTLSTYDFQYWFIYPKRTLIITHSSRGLWCAVHWIYKDKTFVGVGFISKVYSHKKFWNEHFVHLYTLTPNSKFRLWVKWVIVTSNNLLVFLTIDNCVLFMSASAIL